MSKRQYTRIDRYCETCNKLFTVAPWQLAYGAKFCSRKCTDLKNGTLEDRFWKFVEKGSDINDCWKWLSAKHGDGYGHIAGGKRNIVLKAHRVSWGIHFGEVPDDMLVCHKCDNPECTNPLHLFLGTAKDNMQDMASKNRGGKSKGSDRWNSRFTEEQVVDMRQMYADGCSRKEIRDKYGLHRNIANRIITGSVWKHLPHYSSLVRDISLRPSLGCSDPA